MKKSLMLFLAVILMASVFSGNLFAQKKKAAEMIDKMKPAPSMEMLTAMKQTEVDDEIAVLKTNMGTIVLGFFPDVAPKHVARFKELAREGVYDGVHFHRVIPGFMIQAGDPSTKDPKVPRSRHGSGGTDKPNVKNEANKRHHVRGTLAAARTRDLDSFNSQFYICVADQPRLDKMKYTVFGQVLEGMNVVDSIAMVERDARDNPLKPVIIKSVKIKKRNKNFMRK